MSAPTIHLFWFYILFGLLGCANSNRETVEINKELYYDFISLQETKLEQSKAHLEQYQYNVWKRFNTDSDDLLHWFTPHIDVINFILDLFEELSDYNSSKVLEINALYSSDQEYRDKLIADKAEFVDSIYRIGEEKIRETLLGDGNIMRLPEYGKNELYDFYKEQLNDSQIQDIFENLDNLSLHEARMQWFLLDEVFLRSQSAIIGVIDDLLNSGVACYFHSVQPYVVTETPVLSEGEYFEASIALVDFPSALDYTNTMIVVNNDTLDVDSLGFSKYRVKGDKLGVNKLYIEGMVRNRITGGETHGSGEYYFYVEKE